MATTTVSGPWPSGTVVSAYLASALTAGSSTPSGSALSSGTADANGRVELGSLATKVPYVAVGANGRMARFLVPRYAKTGQEADRARMDAIEDAIGPEGSAIAVLRASPLNVRSPEYGAAGDGTTDDTGSVQAALDVAAGRPVVLSGATFRFLSGLTVPAAGATLVLDDATLDFSDAPASSVLIAATGGVGSQVSCDAVARGALTITGSAGFEAGFAVGDLVKLTASDVFDPGRTLSTAGEVVQLASVASGSLGLRSPVMGSYSTGVKVALVSASRLVLRGGGEIVGGGAGSGHIGVKARQTVGLRVDNVRLAGVENVGFQLFDCLDFELSNLDIEGSNYPQGYGVSMVNASQWGQVHHSHFRNCRHATSVNNSNSTDGGGIARHLTVSDNVVRDSPVGDDAIDTHSGCEYITISRNEVFDAGNVGINVECNRATVTDNKVFGSGHNGIYLLACASGPVEYVATGNEVYDSVQYGIRVAALEGAGAQAPRVLDVSGNLAVRCAQAGVFVDPSGQTTSPFRLRAPRVVGNRAEACGASGTVASIYVAQADLVDASGNVVTQQPNGLNGVRLHDCAKGRLNGNLVEFVSGGTVAAVRGTSLSDLEIASNSCKTATGTGGIGLRLDDASSSGCRIHDNGMLDASTPYQGIAGGPGHLIHDNRPGVGLATIASAGTITLTGSENDFFTVSGTTNITSVTASWAGRRVTLIFQGSLTVSDGSNLRLAGDLSAAAQSILELVCDGTNWFEVGRSVN